MAKAKYSYLYNGQVVRNSNRLYKYGLVNHNNAVIACSSTEQGALKDKVYYTNMRSRGLEKLKKQLAQGKTENQFGSIAEQIEDYENFLEKLSKWHTVELEIREN